MPHVMISSKKCTGCHMCELGCSAWHEGGFQPSRARLFADVNPTTAVIKGHGCLQTGCAKCEEACPNDAIVPHGHGHAVGRLRQQGEGRRSVTGVVLVVDEEKCTNCGECYDVCPYGVIHEHPERKVAFKCDLCEATRSASPSVRTSTCWRSTSRSTRPTGPGGPELKHGCGRLASWRRTWQRETWTRPSQRRGGAIAAATTELITTSTT